MPHDADHLPLDPEIAHTVSFTATFNDPAKKAWELKVSPYYSYVVDYIDADRCALAGCLAAKPSNLYAQDSFVYLQFANHDAWLYGVNVNGKLALWDDDRFGQGVFRGNFRIGYAIDNGRFWLTRLSEEKFDAETH